ncbi:MAG: hypothetical protein GY710_01030 [Desulfobacteraceae bacterium]|nr:hypothetical protein [Desulfobacteraceae bacterium]
MTYTIQNPIQSAMNGMAQAGGTYGRMGQNIPANSRRDTRNLDTVKDVIGIVGAMGNLQAMGQRNQVFNQNQEASAQRNVLFEQSQKEFQKQEKVDALTNKMLAYQEENGFQKFPRGDTEPLIYNAARGQAANAYVKTEQGKAALYKVRGASDDRDYGIFQKYQAAILDADAKGDLGTATALIEQYTKDESVPYKYQFDENTGDFKRLCKDIETDEWQEAGRASFDDTVKEILTTNKKKYSLQRFLVKEATRQGNTEAWITGTLTAKKDGKTVYVTPQKNVVSPNDNTYFVVDENNKETVYKSAREMAKAGIRLENLKREKDVAGIDAEKALTGQRNAATNANIASQKLSIAKLNALGNKKIDRTFYDDQANSYSAKSQADVDRFLKIGFKERNPTQNEAINKNNVKSFAIQGKKFGFVQDEETGDVSGIIKRDNMKKTLRLAKSLGLKLYDEEGYEIDENGGWPGGKEQAFKVSVLPPGSQKINAAWDGDKKKGDKFDREKTKAEPVITQMSKKEIKNIFRTGFGDEPAASPWTLIQKAASHYSQPESVKKFGEGRIGSALRDAGIEDDLKYQKTIVAVLKSKFKNATEAQIIEMIKKAS